MVNPSNRFRANPHLGQGLSFPLQINQQGTFALSAAENNVRQSIWLILLTRVGERVYRPDFGCRLGDLAFAPLNPETLMLMRIYVTEALEAWEPRIILEGVTADPDPNRGRVDLTITYRLQNTYDLRSLVYPFYLKEEVE